MVHYLGKSIGTILKVKGEITHSDTPPPRRPWYTLNTCTMRLAKLNFNDAGKYLY